MGLLRIKDEWVPLQAKVFTRWFATQLNKNKSTVNFQDITKDLQNGVALVELAKILTCKETPRKWSSTPKRNIDMVQNCELALDMFSNDGVRFIGISGRDINDNNEKLILGLAWTIISHYSIGSDLKNKSEILDWAIERTSTYDNVKNFQPYELFLCALLDSYVPDKIHFTSLDPNNFEFNSKLATDVMKELEIPVFIYPEDFNNQDLKFDKQILLTQLAAAKDVLENLSFDVPEIKERNIDLPLENSDDENCDEIEEENLLKNDSVEIKVEEILPKNDFIEERKVTNSGETDIFTSVKEWFMIAFIILYTILLILFNFDIL